MQTFPPSILIHVSACLAKLSRVTRSLCEHAVSKIFEILSQEDEVCQQLSILLSKQTRKDRINLDFLDIKRPACEPYLHLVGGVSKVDEPSR